VKAEMILDYRVSVICSWEHRRYDFALCEVSDSDGGRYEDYSLLRYTTL
jgi:hypothetical protein